LFSFSFIKIKIIQIDYHSIHAKNKYAYNVIYIRNYVESGKLSNYSLGIHYFDFENCAKSVLKY